ncbi:hypothetical protein RRG08_024654 [Elysia crispata]|uniref:Uncharacterized protein n=1 Tax=Elysia crispata TaxID=231223 RepID=A0AAE1DN44_9GAST|nr:hypothetical protein RRG08_024654 [Elysia crispata]
MAVNLFTGVMLAEVFLHDSKDCTCANIVYVDITVPLKNDGKSLSMDGLLEFGSRVPNMKIGPLRVLHASYLAVISACLVMGHVFARLYQCGGEEYDFFCKEDNIECFMQMAG